MRFTAEGALTRATGLPQVVTGLALGHDGSIFLGGYYGYWSPVNPLDNVTGDGSVCKVDSAISQLRYATTVPGFPTVGNAIAVGPDGDLFVGGPASATAQFVTPAARQHQFAGGAYDGYVMRITTRPAIDAVTPSSGDGGGGAVVTITGTNFLAGMRVSVGGAPATGVTVLSATKLTAVTPAHAAGAADVRVENADGESATLARAFEYRSSDSTPPVIEPAITGTLGNAGWYISNVTVSWIVSDAESLVSGSTGCGTTAITTDTAGLTITCSATSAGGTQTKSVTIRRDATAPAVSMVQATPALLWPPNHQMVPVTARANSSDALSGVSACSVTSVTSSEPVDGDGLADWGVTSPLGVSVRSERTGNGPGRTYTIVVSCTDTAGNSARGTAIVVVPHDRSIK